MVLEFEGAERMRDALDRVRLAVGEIIARINAPFVAGARMGGVQDTIQHRVAQVEVARGHVDLGAQDPRPVREFAGAHAPEQIKIFLDAALAVGAVAAGLGQRAAHGAHFRRRQIVDIGLAGADQMLGPLVELLEIIGGVVEVGSPIIAEPAHIALDGVDIFLLFLGRVGVVKAQMAAPAIFLGDPEIERNRLGVADMEIPVRLRWKPRNDLPRASGGEIGIDDVANKIAARCCRCFARHYTPRLLKRLMWPIQPISPTPGRRFPPRIDSPSPRPRRPATLIPVKTIR